MKSPSAIGVSARPALVALVLLCLAGPSHAMPSAVTPTGDGDGDSERAAEEDAMFGGGGDDEEEAGPADKTGAGQAAGDAKRHEDFGDPRMAGEATEKTELLDKDRLDIGGLLYIRNGAFLQEETDIGAQPLSLNNLVDVYFDARVNDRVRAFIRGRMLHNPIASANASASLFGINSGNDTVTMALDQLWLKTDVARAVFLTIGAQHVRLGATRLWNPVDIIYATRRNPLTLFDQRTGLPMLKMQIPFEVKLFGTTNAWNAYLIALADSATDLEHLGAAGRLEMVVSTAEIGLSAVKRKGSDARFGVDLSAGIWEFDVTGEVGMRLDKDNNLTWMASAGVQYGFKINDDDTMFIGLEYFHNPDGYDGAESAAAGIASSTIERLCGQGQSLGGLPFTPFYVGKHYAALFAVAMGPGSWNDTNFTLSALSNLSDGTGVAQLVITQAVHTDLRVELFAGVNFGGDGEFRFYSKSLGPAFEKAAKDALAKAAAEGKTGEFLKNCPPDQFATTDASAQSKAPAGQVGINLRLAI